MLLAGVSEVLAELALVAGAADAGVLSGVVVGELAGVDAAVDLVSRESAAVGPHVIRGAGLIGVLAAALVVVGVGVVVAAAGQAAEDHDRSQQQCQILCHAYLSLVSGDALARISPV